MSKNQFNEIIKQKIYHHEEQAPDVLSSIFEKRTAWYIFRNRLIINKYVILAAASIVILLIAVLFNLNNLGHKSETPSIAKDTQNSEIQSSTNVNEQEVASNPTVETTSSQDVNNKMAKKSLVKSSTAANKATTTKNDDASNVETRGVQDFSEFMLTRTKDEQGLHGANDKKSTNQLVINLEEDKHTPSEVGGQVAESNNAGDLNKQTNAPNADVKQNNEGDENIDKSITQVNNTANKPNDAAVETPSSSNQDEILPKSNPLKKWSLIAAYGPTYANRNLDGSTASGVVELRNQTESPLYSNQFMLLANFEITPGFEVYSGASILQRREKLSYLRTTWHNERNITSKEVVEYHPVLPPKTITVYDTTYSQVQTEEQLDRINSYTHISIPFGVRFSGYKRKFGFHPSFDAAIQVASINRGYVLMSELESLNIASANFKRTQIGASVGAGFGISYLIDPRFSFLVEPRATYFLTPTNGNKYQMNQFDYAGSLMLGLKYNF